MEKKKKKRQKKVCLGMWYVDTTLSAEVKNAWICISTPQYAFMAWCSLKAQGQLYLLTASRTALGPTQPPTERVPGALSLGVKRPRREADHSPPSNAKVKNTRIYTSTPPIRLQDVMLN
jgi:hypothetical protein